MKRLILSVPLSVVLAAFTAHSAAAQPSFVSDLKLQVHGFATQGLVYTTKNNWATTNSSDGSPAITEAVVSLSAQPKTRFRIGAQARYSLLGSYGKTVTLDWGQADYKVNELFGIRAGKVKTPSGLFNEIQDIDPAFLWILLPQSTYPLPSRDANLAHFGGVIYGKVALGESVGKLEYHAFGGERVIASNAGYFQPSRDQGYTLPHGLKGPVFGGSLQWDAPLPGLVLGASEFSGGLNGEFDSSLLAGRLDTPKFRRTYYYARYDHKRVTLAGEFNRLQYDSAINAPALGATFYFSYNIPAFYAMANYRIASKLSSGLYYSSSIDRKMSTSSARYQKDWALAARYDFNPYFYAKLEQHFIDGTELNYSTLDNTNLQPNTRMTLLKLGVSF